MENPEQEEEEIKKAPTEEVGDPEKANITVPDGEDQNVVAAGDSAIETTETTGEEEPSQQRQQQEIENASKEVEDLLSEGGRQIEDFTGEGERGIEDLPREGEREFDDFVREGEREFDDFVREGEKEIEDFLKEGERKIEDIPREGEREDIPTEGEREREDIPREEEREREDIPREEEKEREDIPREEEKEREEIPREEEREREDIPKEEGREVEDIPREGEREIEDIPKEEERERADIPREGEREIEDIPREGEREIEDIPRGEEREDIPIEEGRETEDIPRGEKSEDIPIEEGREIEDIPKEKEDIPIEEERGREDIPIAEDREGEDFPIAGEKEREDIPIEEERGREDIPIAEGKDIPREEEREKDTDEIPSELNKTEEETEEKTPEVVTKDETTPMVQSGDGIEDQIPLPPEIPASTEPISKEEGKEGENAIVKEEKDADGEKPGETDGIPIPPKLESPEEEKEEEGKLMPNSALNISWSFGFNQSIPVWNLTDEKRTLIMYTSSHAGIIYDYQTNTQSILQGHANSISCTSISKDKKWLVTADKGKDNTVIVWNTRTHFPVRTLFSASSEGMEAIALSPDAKYLATMSAGDVQEFAIWDWTVSQDKPLASVILNPGFCGQNYIFFCEENMSYIVSNSEHQVIFYQWKDDTINYFAPPLTDQDFHITIGKYSQSIIIADTIHALTGTSVGNLVVWDTDIFGVEGKKRKIANKKAAKIIQLVTCGITVLTLQDTNIVIGDASGNVSFYDQRMTLLHCFNSIGLGPIRSISFGLRPDEESDRSLYPETSTMAAENIVLPDFVVSTSSARCGLVHVVEQEVQVIISDHGKPIPAIATHPFKPFLATGSRAGKLKVYNYLEKVSIASCSFDKEIIESCAFSPDGCHLALGFYSGVIRVLDSFTLKAEKRDIHNYSKHAILQVVFSANSEYLAAGDAGFTTSLLKKEDSTFVFIGRFRAHYKPIRMLMFGEKFNTEEPRLLSLGEDRMLVEYDLGESTENNVKILSIERIEQSATPRCMAWHPPLNKEHFIVTANDQYKYKLYNSMTMMCRKTVLGPIYENPIEKLIILPIEGIDPKHMYMAFMTQDKVGLQILPFDGNPHQSTGLIAHPGGVHNFVASNDGVYLFTTSSEECSIHMWQINPSALEAQVRLGGEDLTPFYRLMDGGKEGEFFEELKEYFYYCQLQSSDINSMSTRVVTTVIPITQIPYMMRALGFYPSEQELANMINEVKYSEYVDKGEFKELINLPEFLKLYINHRPYRDLTGERLKWAFNVLGECRGESEDSSIPTNEMLKLIQTQGEHITSEEFDEILMDLCLLDLDCSNRLGNYKDGGKIKDFSHLAGFIDNKLPKVMTAQTFAFNLLDLPENTFDDC